MNKVIGQPEGGKYESCFHQSSSVFVEVVPAIWEEALSRGTHFFLLAQCSILQKYVMYISNVAKSSEGKDYVLAWV